MIMINVLKVCTNLTHENYKFFTQHTNTDTINTLLSTFNSYITENYSKIALKEINEHLITKSANLC